MKISVLHEINKRPEVYDGSWMGSKPNEAFLISIGAGPWKEKRRQNVQRAALDWYKSEKITDLFYVKNLIRVYPFAWQNKFLHSMTKSLHSRPATFRGMCRNWQRSNDWEHSLKELFEMCQVSEAGAKVLWMFARDYLDIPAFPVDRWVRKFLDKNGFPDNSWEMTKICTQEGLNPNVLNRKLFEGKNPDWSHI